MRKNKVLLFFVFLLITLFTSSLFININNINLAEYWFSSICVCIGLYSLLYYIMYKLDSSLYYGTLILNIGISSVVQQYFNFGLAYFYPTYILCFSLASFAVFAIFRQNIHFKIFAILTFEGILLIVYKLKILNMLNLLIINGVYLLVIGLNILLRIKRNLRRIK